jgi:hypothetical protein
MPRGGAAGGVDGTSTIDHLVYELYDLTDSAIAIVEGRWGRCV